MVGTGSRLFYALGVVGLLAAGVYGLATDGDPIGVMSLGYKGGVGEHFGYSVLVLFAAASLTLGVFGTVLRDADPVIAESGADVLPEAPAPDSASPWPIVGALALVLMALGLVVGAGLFALGVALLAVTVVEWAVKVWADRATGDPGVNLAIRNRLMAPFEIPLAAVLVIAFLVLGISRVLLAVSATTAVVIGSVAACVILLGAILVYSRPKQAATTATVLLVLGALAVIGGGIAGVAAGEREFHHEEPAHEVEE